MRWVNKHGAYYRAVKPGERAGDQSRTPEALVWAVVLTPLYDRKKLETEVIFPLVAQEQYPYEVRGLHTSHL